METRGQHSTAEGTLVTQGSQSCLDGGRTGPQVLSWDALVTGGFSFKEVCTWDPALISESWKTQLPHPDRSRIPLSVEFCLP